MNEVCRGCLDYINAPGGEWHCNRDVCYLHDAMPRNLSKKAIGHFENSVKNLEEIQKFREVL